MLLSEYAADVFIAAKTGLFYKIFPEEILTFKEDKCIGDKKAKQDDQVTTIASALYWKISKDHLFFKMFQKFPKYPKAFCHILFYH